MPILSNATAVIAGATTLAALYLALVKRRRYQQINRIHHDYAKRHGCAPPPLTRRDPSRAPTSSELPMTPAEAQAILLPGAKNEFPFVIGKALQFALFKTYGIPSISDLLYKTTEFTAPERAGRRYVDTSVLILGFLQYPITGPGSGVTGTPGVPADPRNALCIARMNWIHSRYSGKITNDDFLYTLSTFIFEPAVWTRTYEWRSLTPLEERAWFVFFCEVGRRMGIKDIPAELSEFEEWAEAYEKEHMLPATSCRDVAKGTTRLLLHNVPSFLHSFGEKVVACLLYDRLRESIMLPPPPALLKTLVQTSLHARGFFIRHFCLPRPRKDDVEYLPSPAEEPAFPAGYIPLSSSLHAASKRKSTSSAASTKSLASDDDIDNESLASTAPTSDDDELMFAPRSHAKIFDNEPWYVNKPTGLSAFLNNVQLVLGLKRPDQVPGDAFRADGYRLEEIGPIRFEKNAGALDEVRRLAEAIHGGILEGPYAVGGAPASRCPFSP